MQCQRCAGAALTKAGRDRSGRQLYCCGTCRRRQTPHSAAAFGGYRCPDDIIAPVVRWYLRFRLPYGVMRTSRTRPPRPLACAGLGPWPTLALRSAGVRHGHRQPAARVLGRRAAGSPCPGPRAPRLRGPAVCAAWRPHPAPRPLGAPGAPQGPRPAVRSHSFCALSHRSCAQNPTVCEPSYRCPLRLCETPRPQGTGRTDRRTTSGILCRVAHELWDVWLKNSGILHNGPLAHGHEAGLSTIVRPSPHFHP
jgi:hypothetical protein